MVSARLLALAGPPLAVAALVVVNAWPGLMPGVGFWDTGEFQVVLPVMGTAHPTGYPTYVLLGFLGNILLTPIGEPAFRITVLSLLAVATAAAATVLLVRRLTGSTIVGIATGLGLATTPVVWVNATRADPHPIHLAFVALLLLALVRWAEVRREVDAPHVRDAGPTKGAANPAWTATAPTAPAAPASRVADRWLVLAAILFGLAAGNHSLTLLLVPPIALYVLAVEPEIWRRRRFGLACLASALATVAAVYLELPVRGGLLPAPLVYGEPATWDGFWYIALAEQFRGSLSNPFADLPMKLDELVTLARDQLGLLALAIPAAVLVAARRAPRYLLLTGAATIITVLFNEAYSNADIQRYYLGPVLWVWTWLGILGAEVAALAGVMVAGRAGGPGSAGGGRTLARGTALAAVIVGVVLLLPALGDLDARRKAADRSSDSGAARWLDESLPVLAQDAVIVSWWSTSTPLWYAQHVEGRRTDVFVVDDRTMLDLRLGRAPDVINRYLDEGRPVYAIRLQGRDLDELTSQFDMTKVASEGNTAVYAVNGRLAAIQ
jgi:4-amino-4-deoxy-L-arabinose transferase-like glycosyltransferase